MVSPGWPVPDSGGGSGITALVYANPISSGGGAGIGRDKPVMRKLRGRPDHWRSNHTHTVTHSYTHTRVQVQLFTMDFDEKEMMPTMRDWMPQTPMTWKT